MAKIGQGVKKTQRFNKYKTKVDMDKGICNWMNSSKLQKYTEIGET